MIALLKCALPALLLSLAGAACTAGPEQEIPIQRDPTQQELQMASAANEFGFSLFQEVVAAEDDSNVFISPLSVSFALGMTYNGAQGDTETAMRQTLGYDNLTMQEINEAYLGLMTQLTGLDPKVQMEIANSIWYREGLTVLPDFVQRNEQYFDAQVQALDFSAADAASTINDWVAQKTHDKITEIVDDPIAADLVMFLINAVYFKGTWTIQFDPAHTHDGGFTTDLGTIVQVPLMRLHDDLRCMETADFKAVDLDYGDGLFRMAVFLPKPGVSLDTIVNQMDANNWNTWMGQFSVQEAELTLPRFELEYEKSLKQMLQNMGMEIAFAAGGADFSGINGARNLFISDVKHKTYVKVDEEGTEAAAVTSVEVGITSVPQYFTMVVNRPFIIVIHDVQTQTMLFMGKIGDPS
jgi:serpin B